MILKQYLRKISSEEYAMTATPSIDLLPPEPAGVVYVRLMHNPLPSWHGLTSIHLLLLAVILAAALGFLIKLLS